MDEREQSLRSYTCDKHIIRQCGGEWRESLSDMRPGNS